MKHYLHDSTYVAWHCYDYALAPDCMKVIRHDKAFIAAWQSTNQIGAVSRDNSLLQAFNSTLGIGENHE